MASTRNRKSDAPTASEAELQARERGPEGDDTALKQAAKDERRQQDEQLAAGKGGPAERRVVKSLKTPAEKRAGYAGARPVHGHIDQMTRESAEVPMVGHMVNIDGSNKDAVEAVEALIGEGNFSPQAGSYGVLFSVGNLDENGYPTTGTVFTRDEHGVHVTVPFEALSPATQGGRR
jgi:hypothetical protein